MALEPADQAPEADQHVSIRIMRPRRRKA